MKQFFVIAQPEKENVFIDAKYKDMSTADLIKENQFVDSYLYIVTPNYQVLLKSDQKPVQEYPELIHEVPIRPHQRPQNYLLLLPIIPDSDENITFFVHLITNHDFHLTPLPFEFNPHVIDTTNKFIDCFKKEIPFVFANAELDINNCVFSKNCSIEELMFLMKNYHITCRLDISSSSKQFSKLVERSRLIKSFIQDENNFLSLIAQLSSFWQSAMIKEQLLTRNDASFIFSSFKSTIKAHNYFLQEFKKRVTENEECVADVFCDLPLYFNNTNDLFVNYTVIDLFFKIKCQQNSFTQKIDTILKQKTDGVPFFDLLFSPISRLNEFFTFFTRIKVLTPDFHPDNVFLKEGETILNKFIVKMKEWLRREPAGLIEVAKVQSRLNINKYDIMSPTRAILSSFKGQIDLTKNGIFYIFSDLVLITEPSETLKGVGYEKGVFKADGSDFRYLTEENAIIIELDLKKCLKFTFAKPKDFEFALQQISDLNMFYFSKLRIMDRLLVSHCFDRTYSLPVQAGSCAVNIKGYIYLIGGYSKTKFSTNISVYNLLNGHFTTIPNPLIGRKFHAVAEIKGVIYIFGGMGSDSTVLGDFLSVDTNSQNNIVPIKSMRLPSPRYGHSLVGIYGHLILFGGIDSNKKMISDTSVFAISGNSWKPILASNSPCARAFHSAVAMNDMVIFHGGINGNKVLDDVVILKVKTMEWVTPTLEGDILMPRHSHRAVVYHNWMVIIGGTNESGIILPPFGIHFKGTKGYVTNFASGGNDRPNLANFSLVTNNQELIIAGGSDKSTDIAAKGIFRLTLPKIVLEKEKNENKDEKEQERNKNKSDNNFYSKATNNQKNSDDRKEPRSTIGKRSPLYDQSPSISHNNNHNNHNNNNSNSNNKNNKNCNRSNKSPNTSKISTRNGVNNDNTNEKTTTNSSLANVQQNSQFQRPPSITFSKASNNSSYSSGIHSIRRSSSYETKMAERLEQLGSLYNDEPNDSSISLTNENELMPLAPLYSHIIDHKALPPILNSDDEEEYSTENYSYNKNAMNKASSLENLDEINNQKHRNDEEHMRISQDTNSIPPLGSTLLKQKKQVGETDINNQLHHRHHHHEDNSNSMANNKNIDNNTKKENESNESFKNNENNKNKDNNDNKKENEEININDQEKPIVKCEVNGTLLPPPLDSSFDEAIGSHQSMIFQSILNSVPDELIYESELTLCTPPSPLFISQEHLLQQAPLLPPPLQSSSPSLETAATTTTGNGAPVEVPKKIALPPFLASVDSLELGEVGGNKGKLGMASLLIPENPYSETSSIIPPIYTDLSARSFQSHPNDENNKEDNNEKQNHINGNQAKNVFVSSSTEESMFEYSTDERQKPIRNVFQSNSTDEDHIFKEDFKLNNDRSLSHEEEANISPANRQMLNCSNGVNFGIPALPSDPKMMTLKDMNSSAIAPQHPMIEVNNLKADIKENINENINDNEKHDYPPMLSSFGSESEKC